MRFLGHGTVVSACVAPEGIGLNSITSPVWGDASDSTQPFSEIDGVYLRRVGPSGPKPGATNIPKVVGGGNCPEGLVDQLFPSSCCQEDIPYGELELVLMG